MSARFRVRTSGGQELSFASEQVFAEFVRSGDLSPDDVVYDAETKEWASARTHPVVLQIQLAEEEEVAERDAGGEAPPAESRRAVDPSLPEASESFPPVLDIGLDLAPAPQSLSPEEEARLFVAKMEAERASEIASGDDANRLGLRMEQGASGLLEAPPLPPSTREVPPALASRVCPPVEPAPREPEPPHPAVRAAPAPPKRKRGAGAAWRYAPFVILAAAVAVAAAYFGPELFGPAGGTGAAAREQPPGEPIPPASPALIPDTEEALRARARERFLAATQAELRGLDEIPDVWLRGAYLAGPSDYPAVLAVWEEYLATARAVRAGEVERYRSAYARALEDARVADTLRARRLERATAAFLEGAGSRAAHWNRVEALALAAIQGHDALLRAEGTIAYQPAAGPVLSRDTVIEAVGRGPEAQALLDQVLALVLARLRVEGGPGQAANVREWVWTGFLDAVAH